MTEKRFECDNPLDYRGYGIFDLSKANKTKGDFRDEDGICLYEFHNYLVDETSAMMTGEEVEDLLNKLFDKNEQLKQENKGIQHKVWRLLNYLCDVEKCITKEQVKEWWNKEMENDD